MDICVFRLAARIRVMRRGFKSLQASPITSNQILASSVFRGLSTIGTWHPKITAIESPISAAWGPSPRKPQYVLNSIRPGNALTQLLKIGLSGVSFESIASCDNSFPPPAVLSMATVRKRTGNIVYSVQKYSPDYQGREIQSFEVPNTYSRR